MLGVDEAGRGPVLGPMVYGISYCSLSAYEDLKTLKCADSKTLTEVEREKLFEKINDSDFVGWMLEILSPNVICNNMLKRSKYNLNALSHDSAIGLIQRAIDAGVNVAEVYVDTVGDPDKYQAKLSEIFNGIKVTVAKKADSTYPIVSAASICAKVARDLALKTWNFKEDVVMTDVPYGSGYPSDPATKKYLSENVDKIFGFPQIVRFSWSTVDKILNDRGVQVTWDNVDDDEEEGAPTPSVLSYFQRSSSAHVVQNKLHQFFTERALYPVSTL
jgi:ribonuclease H2 subunit A